MIQYAARDYVPHLFGSNFNGLIHHISRDFLTAPAVDTGHWQAMKNVPQTKTFEHQNVVIEYPIPTKQEGLADEVAPSTPWAELQFRERVAGVPVNPGETYQLWPWYRGNVEKHQDEVKQFSHTYMERFWPRYAGYSKLASVTPEHKGIRYRYGDLNDVLDLLAREPHTRQAYLPIFFPEDTGAPHGERIPCTLGYHFLLRDGKLNVTYFIRSCDFYRHFRDDVYMAARLCQWVLEQMKKKSSEGSESNWHHVTPGNLVMHMTSLHIFEGDLPRLKRDLDA